MKSFNPVKAVGLVLAAATIIACYGSGNSVQPVTFPLNRAVFLNVSNTDPNLPIHVFEKTKEDFDPTNRVAPSSQGSHQLQSRTFTDANSTHTYTIVAGRNGNPITEKPITITGAQAKAGKNISATWNGTTLTLN